MNISIERSPTLKFRLHIIIGSLVSVVFILIIARITNNGTPKTRTNIWGIAVVSKPPSIFDVHTTDHNLSVSNQQYSWPTRSWQLTWIGSNDGQARKHTWSWISSIQFFGSLCLLSLLWEPWDRLLRAVVHWGVSRLRLFSSSGEWRFVWSDNWAVPTDLFKSGFAGLLSFVSIRDRRYFKAHGALPGPGMVKHSVISSWAKLLLYGFWVQGMKAITWSMSPTGTVIVSLYLFLCATEWLEPCNLEQTLVRAKYYIIHDNWDD